MVFVSRKKISEEYGGMQSQSLSSHSTDGGKGSRESAGGALSLSLNDLVSIGGFIRAQHLGEEREQLDDHPPCSVGRY